MFTFVLMGVMMIIEEMNIMIEKKYIYFIFILIIKLITLLFFVHLFFDLR